MIYSSPEAAPARLAVLLRTARATGPLTAERLESLTQPPSVRGTDDAGAARECLAIALELGLLRPAGDDQPPRFAPASAATSDTLTYEDGLKELGRRLLGRQMPVVDHAAPHEYYQFARLTAWFLDQPLARGPGLAQVVERWGQIAEPGFRTIDEAGFERFLAWAVALGILKRLNVGRQQPIHLTVVNPTPFLRRHLADFMGPGVAQPSPDWLRALADHFPVFDRGWVRQGVRPIENQILTPTLSLAVRQLADEGRLALEDRKDAPRLRLRVGRYEQQFTHVTLTGGGVG